MLCKLTHCAGHIITYINSIPLSIFGSQFVEFYPTTFAVLKNSYIIHSACTKNSCVTHEHIDQCVSLQVRMSNSVETERSNVDRVQINLRWNGACGYIQEWTQVGALRCCYPMLNYPFCTINHLYARMLMMNAHTPQSCQKQLAVFGLLDNFKCSLIL